MAAAEAAAAASNHLDRTRQDDLRRSLLATIGGNLGFCLLGTLLYYLYLLVHPYLIPLAWAALCSIALFSSKTAIVLWIQRESGACYTTDGRFTGVFAPGAHLTRSLLQLPVRFLMASIRGTLEEGGKRFALAVRHALRWGGWLLWVACSALRAPQPPRTLPAADPAVAPAAADKQPGQEPELELFATHNSPPRRRSPSSPFPRPSSVGSFPGSSRFAAFVGSLDDEAEESTASGGLDEEDFDDVSHGGEDAAHGHGAGGDPAGTGHGMWFSPPPPPSSAAVVSGRVVLADPLLQQQPPPQQHSPVAVSPIPLRMPILDELDQSGWSTVDGSYWMLTPRQGAASPHRGRERKRFALQRSSTWDLGSEVHGAADAGAGNGQDFSFTSGSIPSLGVDADSPSLMLPEAHGVHDSASALHSSPNPGPPGASLDIGGELLSEDAEAVAGGHSVDDSRPGLGSPLELPLASLLAAPGLRRPRKRPSSLLPLMCETPPVAAAGAASQHRRLFRRAGDWSGSRRRLFPLSGARSPPSAAAPKVEGAGTGDPEVASSAGQPPGPRSDTEGGAAYTNVSSHFSGIEFAVPLDAGPFHLLPEDRSAGLTDDDDDEEDSREETAVGGRGPFLAGPPANQPEVLYTTNPSKLLRRARLGPRRRPVSASFSGGLPAPEPAAGDAGFSRAPTQPGLASQSMVLLPGGGHGAPRFAPFGVKASAGGRHTAAPCGSSPEAAPFGKTPAGRHRTAPPRPPANRGSSGGAGGAPRADAGSSTGRAGWGFPASVSGGLRRAKPRDLHWRWLGRCYLLFFCWHHPVFFWGCMVYSLLVGAYGQELLWLLSWVAGHLWRLVFPRARSAAATAAETAAAAGAAKPNGLHDGAAPDGAPATAPGLPLWPRVLGWVRARILELIRMLLRLLDQIRLASKRRLIVHVHSLVAGSMIVILILSTLVGSLFLTIRIVEESSQVAIEVKAAIDRADLPEWLSQSGFNLSQIDVDTYMQSTTDWLEQHYPTETQLLQEVMRMYSNFSAAIDGGSGSGLAEPILSVPVAPVVPGIGGPAPTVPGEGSGGMDTAAAPADGGLWLQAEAVHPSDSCGPQEFLGMGWSPAEASGWAAPLSRAATESSVARGAPTPAPLALPEAASGLIPGAAACLGEADCRYAGIVAPAAPGKPPTLPEAGAGWLVATWWSRVRAAVLPVFPSAARLAAPARFLDEEEALVFAEARDLGRVRGMPRPPVADAAASEDTFGGGGRSAPVTPSSGHPPDPLSPRLGDRRAADAGADDLLRSGSGAAALATEEPAPAETRPDLLPGEDQILRLGSLLLPDGIAEFLTLEHWSSLHRRLRLQDWSFTRLYSTGSMFFRFLSTALGYTLQHFSSASLSFMNFLVSMSLFLTAFFNLLQSRWSALHRVIQLLPVSTATGVRVYHALTNAVRRVFIVSIEVCLFHALFTWLVFSVFDLHFAYISAVTSGVLGVLPFAPSWIVAVPAFVELWVLRSNPIAAIFVWLAHFFYLSWVVDLALYHEIPNSHPWIVGWAVVMGIYAFGLHGVVLGPLCVILATLVHDVLYEGLHHRRSERRRT